MDTFVLFAQVVLRETNKDNFTGKRRECAC